MKASTLASEKCPIDLRVGLFVVLFTVGYHGMKATHLNPAEALKNESTNIEYPVCRCHF